MKQTSTIPTEHPAQLRRTWATCAGMNYSSIKTVLLTLMEVKMSIFFQVEIKKKLRNKLDSYCLD